MHEAKFTNHLINETSPYLLQHAHNPVDWYPWGEEAFAKARAENKAVLLSIGYSACHWCHVMAHESFEDEEIARLMNENFVNIKVDREERPDLDQIYMNAVQMMTHHGGWPMTVFLTPEGVPFYGGTYFPPQDRYNMPGFPRVLIGVAEAFNQRREDIKETGTSLVNELRRLSQSSASDLPIEKELLDAAYAGIVRSYDSTNGGFGGAPKFPPAMTLEFLLRTYARTRDQNTLQLVNLTCRKMAEGGIYDQLGGGFHRYSTDSRWLVPHFEKMLYDNALLSRFYLHYYQLTRDEAARQVAEGILDYVVREMTDPLGGFYSTQDADSEGIEGRFFVWDLEEVKQILGEPDAGHFAAYYDITGSGNFEEKNILNVTRELAEVARVRNITPEQLSQILESGRSKLFAAREQRIKPARDEKVLTAWNGLMLASFAEASVILGRSDYADAAKRNADFVLKHLQRDGLLLRTYKDGQAKLNAYLEDYAFLIDGLLTLFETAGDFRWFEEAVKLTETMIREFWDEQDGGFFYTGNSHEELIVCSKDFFDNATPSGNSVAAEVLLRLSVLTGNSDFERRATTILRLTSDTMRRYPSGFGRLLGALDFHLARPKELAVIGSAETGETQELLKEIWRPYLPNKVVAQAAPEDTSASSSILLLRDRPQLAGKATVYVCENYTCQQPTADVQELTTQLNARAANAG